MDGPLYAGMPPATSPRSSNGLGYRYYGVGGWLLLFIFTLVFIGPGTRAYGFIEAYDHSMQICARSAHSTAAYIYYFVDALFSFTVYGYGIFAGIELWRIRPGAAQKAKLFILGLLAFALLHYASEFMWVFLAVPEAVRASALSRVAAGRGAAYLFEVGGYAFIWYTYLLKSKRVRMTFAMEKSVETTFIHYAGSD